MSIIVAISLALQLLCLIHMVRSRRPYWWGFVLAGGSFLGVLVYLLVEVLPERIRKPGPWQVFAGLVNWMNPDHRRHHLEAALKQSDTVENRQRLAEEYLRLGETAQAAALYRSCLSNSERQDPELLLGLARAYLANGDGNSARATLEVLFANASSRKTGEAHLLYAQSLQMAGLREEALREYAALSETWSGEEARIRYAELLMACGRSTEAERLLKRVISRTERAPKQYRQTQQSWIARAQHLLNA